MVSWLLLELFKRGDGEMREWGGGYKSEPAAANSGRISSTTFILIGKTITAAGSPALTHLAHFKAVILLKRFIYE
jgi:hypothetical protein